VLVFLWQDNNSGIGKAPGGLLNRPTHPTSAPARLTGTPLPSIVMSTVHSIHLVEDGIERFRRRPRVTSTNAKNVRDVFPALRIGRAGPRAALGLAGQAGREVAVVRGRSEVRPA
jgi:hypothetical protein